MHPYPVTEQNEREWFNNAVNDRNNGRFIFTIIYQETDDVIGYFQLTNVNMVNRNAMLGIVIGDKEYQGKGLGKEILGLGIGYGFDYLGLRKISLDVLVEKTFGIKLYKKMGFIEEGKFIEQYFFNNGYHSLLRMAIFKF